MGRATLSQRAHFGRSSEKLDPDQLQLAFEDIEQALARSEAEEEKLDATLRMVRTRTRSEARKSLPAHTPRVEQSDVEPTVTRLSGAYFVDRAPATAAGRAAMYLPRCAGRLGAPLY
jgi:hypothetical protein